jgi:ABC-2 type transport system permease protein
VSATVTERAPTTGARPQRLSDVVAAEWVKFRTVPSTPVTLGIALVLSIGIGTIICAAYAAKYATLSLPERILFDPAFLSESGILLAQVAIGVLGVLAMTAEYATGLVRVTVGAVPRRLLILESKVVVYGAASLVVGAVMSVTSFICGQAVLGTHGIETTIGAPGVGRVLLGATVYLGGIGLLGVALGSIIRRTSGAVAALFGILLVLPTIVSTLPDPWGDDVGKYLPGSAGSSMLHIVARQRLLSPWVGFAIFAGYIAVAHAISGALFLRRDA